MRAPLRLVAIVAPLLTTASTALAADAPKCPANPPTNLAKRRSIAGDWFDRGAAAATANDLPTAVAAYSCSLRLSPHAFTAYNLGRVAEKVGDVELAVDAYETYLRLASPEESDRAEVEASLARLRGERERVRGLTTPEPAVAPEPPPLHKTPAVNAVPQAAQTRPAPPKEAPHTSWVGYAVGGGGVAALAAGAALNLMARSKADACSKDIDRQDWSAATSACDGARTMAYASYAGMGLGAAGLIAGTWLLMSNNGTGPETARSSSRPSFAVRVAPAGASLLMSGSF